MVIMMFMMVIMMSVVDKRAENEIENKNCFCERRHHDDAAWGRNRWSKEFIQDWHSNNVRTF